MGHIHEEVLLSMKTMDDLLDDAVEELLYGTETPASTCYKLRMYADWMMGTVGFSPLTYSEFAKLRDSFLEFEELLTLDDRDVNADVGINLFSQVKEFRRIVGELIASLEEVI